MKSDLVRIVLDLVALIDVQEFDSLAEEHFLRYAIRCLASLVRGKQALNEFMAVEEGFAKLLIIIDTVQDEEIMANAFKVCKGVLKDE